MENENLIKKLANAAYPFRCQAEFAKMTDYFDAYSDTEEQRRAVKHILTLLEPFIPKWVSARERMPEKGELVVCKWHPDLNKPVTYGMFVDLDGYFLAGVIEWMYLPSTTHPFELLLNKLISNETV